MKIQINIDEKELKPCPFCGSQNINIHKGKYAWSIECCNADCNASLTKILKVQAIEAWNKRAELSFKNKTNDKAHDILDKWEFFLGQRAGRELWNDKPKEVQDKDIKDFLRDIEILRSSLSDNDVPDTNVGKWIPMTEEKPKESGKYLTTVHFDGKFGCMSLYYDVLLNKFIGNRTVLAWCKPEPTRGEE